MIDLFFLDLTPLILVSCAVAMIVLRAGASMVFFDIVGTFQAGRLIKDSAAAMTAFEGLMLDGLSNVEDAVMEVFRPLDELRNATMPIAEDVELARIEFEKFVRDANQAALGQEITEIGNAFGYTAEQSFQAGARMAQLASVMGEAALPAAVKTSLAFGLIGEMEARAAPEKMISRMQQPQFVFHEVTREEYALMSAQEQRIHVTKEMSNAINALNSIEDNSAAIMPQIVSAMNEFAGAATLAGDSIEFMAAMSAMLIERGVTAQKAGTSLRMAYARLGANINGAAEAVEAYGVQVKDSEGNMRGLETILNELAPVYQGLAEGQRMALAQAIAGNRHYARFVFLMEDLTRVNQLATEGYIQSKPVMDEAGNAIEYLADRMATQHHQLQVARAELDKWQGALGEGFIPATTLATERQADFYKQVVLTTNAMTEAYPLLGDIAGRLMAMQQIAETMYAPFLSALLNIKQLQVALMTFHAIQRAVSGERIAYFDNEARGYGMMTNNQYSLNRLVGLYNEGLWNTVELKLAAIRVEQQLSADNAKRLHTEWVALKARRDKVIEMIMLGKKDVENAQNAVWMEQRRLAPVQRRKSVEAQAIARDALTDPAARAKATSRYTSAMHRLNAAEAEHTRLKHLNIAAIDKQMNSTNKLYMAESARMKNLTGTHRVIHQTGGAMHYYDDSMDNATQSTGEMNWQLSGLQTSLMQASMGAMAATGVISLLGDVLWKGGDGAQAARIQMISMALAGGIMMVQMTQAMTSMGGAAIQAGNLAKANNAAAVSFNHLAQRAAAASGAVTGASAGIASTMGWVLWWTAGIIAASWALEKIGGWLGLWKDEATHTQNYDYEWFNNNQNQQNYFDTTSITDWSDALDTAKEEMYEFGNAREELFFGFKAGSVSGALIKQIEQKGIENFVANTEVIQTNNFNGLTTDQVANVILDAIESEGRERGIVF